MDKMIAFCGLDCAQCDAYKATMTNNEALRAETAAKWSKEYNYAFTPDLIHCSGCQAEGVKFGHCLECEMRLCGLKRGVDNCGACAAYEDCAIIGPFLKAVPPAKVNLEEYRAKRAR